MGRILPWAQGVAGSNPVAPTISSSNPHKVQNERELADPSVILAVWAQQGNVNQVAPESRADSSVNSAAGHGALAVECEAGFRCHVRCHQACHILPHRGSMLEAMT